MSKNTNSLKEKIKILLVSPLPSKTAFGGIGSWTVRFVDALERNQNFEIKIINSVPVDRSGNDIARSKNIFKKINCNTRLLKKIKKELNDFKPNVVHLNSSCTPLACVRDNVFLKAIFKKRVSSILHCRCNIEDQIHNNKIGLHFFKKNVRTASCILALNKSSKQFVDNLNKANAKCFIVPNFLKKSSIIEHKRISDHVTCVLFVGHLVEQKGIDEIIFLANEFPNLHFVLACGFTEQYPNASLFPQNVEITGNLSNEKIFQELDKTDVFLFPTHSEGFSNALLEAMARGVPSIATSVGANADMLENKGGFIVESNSKEQLKNALIEIDSKIIREKMSKWSIDKVANSYTDDIVLKQILAIYYELLGIKEVQS